MKRVVRLGPKAGSVLASEGATGDKSYVHGGLGSGKLEKPRINRVSLCRTKYTRWRRVLCFQ